MNCLYCCTVLTKLNHEADNKICHNCKQNERKVKIAKKKLKGKKNNGSIN